MNKKLKLIELGAKLGLFYKSISVCFMPFLWKAPRLYRGHGNGYFWIHAGPLTIGVDTKTMLFFQISAHLG